VGESVEVTNTKMDAEYR